MQPYEPSARVNPRHPRFIDDRRTTSRDFDGGTKLSQRRGLARAIVGVGSRRNREGHGALDQSKGGGGHVPTAGRNKIKEGQRLIGGEGKEDGPILTGTRAAYIQASSGRSRKHKGSPLRIVSA